VGRATDNVGVFFGEDIFVAIASILLIKGFLEQFGIELTPLELSLWAIPTAIAGLHHPRARLLRLDRRLRRGARGDLARRGLPARGLVFSPRSRY
jgi:uncharacterized membrane protein